MNRRFIGILVAVFGIALVASGPAFGTVTVLTPGDLDFSQGFGSDPDMPPPIGSNVAGPTGFGSGSFWSDVQGSANGGPRDYTTVRLLPNDIFGVDNVTIGQLSEISYWTKNNDLNLIDWQLKIYTEGDSNWYGHRFNFTRPENADNDWHLWSTDTSLVDSIYDKNAGAYLPVSSGYDLDAIQADYGDKNILFMDIIAGFATNSPAVDSNLDGITLTLVDGSSVTADLEAAGAGVPEPASVIVWSLLGGSWIGLGVYRRRRRGRFTERATPWSEESRTAIHQIIERGNRG